MDASYSPPVAQLLELGEDPVRQNPWPDYLALGLTREHVPELIRLLNDPDVQEYDEDSPRGFWPPIHAWRALGQLQAEEALEPLFTLLQEPDEGDFRFSQIPRVLGMIGPAAISPARRMAAQEELDEYTRYVALGVLPEVAAHWPDSRDQCVEVLTAFLRDWSDQDPEFNASVIAELVDMKATEAAPLIAAAFEGDAVDISVNGDWEDVQVQMGLLAERTTPDNFPFKLRSSFAHPAEAAPRRARPGQKTKNRRKDARAARKRNRRK
jgi:hypothetical protein